MENLREGDVKPGQRVVVIEDLISTGGSSLKAVNAIRKDGCEVVGMMAIFTYGFPVAVEQFAKEGVELTTLSNYEAVLSHLLKTEFIGADEMVTLQAWRKDPANWVPTK